MARRNCPNCLSPVSPGTTLCPYCRASIPEPGPGAAVSVGQRAAPPNSPGTEAANRTDQPATPATVLSLKALVAAAGVLVLGTVLGGVMLLLLYSYWLSARGITGAAMIAASRDDPVLLGSELIVGLGLTVACAYMAARWAGQRPYRHAAVLGGAALLVGLLALVSGAYEGPAWFIASSGLLTMPCALYGGYLAARAAPGSRIGNASARIL